MSRLSERDSRRWSTVSRARKTSSGSSTPIEEPTYVKNTSTPLRNRWSDSEEINRSLRIQRDVGEETQEESDEESGKSRGRKGSLVRAKGTLGRQDDRERVPQRRKGRHESRKRQKRDRSPEPSPEEGQKVSTSSSKRYAEDDGDRLKRKHEGEDELPITEILKRSQENARTKYEHQLPLPELTTDKIYVQHRGGFSALKIRSRDSRSGQKLEPAGDNEEKRDSPPISVAIAVQQLWKSAGHVFQGLLGGMALMHFIMLQVCFDATMEFVEEHSRICEIYTNIFSFLIILCIVSTLDKFDLARLDVDHLREIYVDYSKTVIAVPLYLVVFCLHQVCSRTDNLLASAHYYTSNFSIWDNVTDVQSVLDNLNSWQRMSMSKDILAVLAWLFVSLGTKDDAFLIHLQSMEKYAGNVDQSRE
ncbi:uncharacterized protein LOC143352509 [Halictus rubicundus]|uniref:uncharacterized protein LOC143352509 n=1 Tax=Halictus rubicundus TaxID=77578 RepID=UPI0040368CB7